MKSKNLMPSKAVAIGSGDWEPFITSIKKAAPHDCKAALSMKCRYFRYASF
jgi:hypothetical protein